MTKLICQEATMKKSGGNGLVFTSQWNMKKVLAAQTFVSHWIKSFSLAPASVSLYLTSPISCFLLSFCFLADVTKPPTHSYHHPPANIEYRGRNYKVVSGNMSWYDAMQKCKEKNLELVSVTDAYHQAFLTVLVNRLGVPHWIGLSSQDVCIRAIYTVSTACNVHVRGCAVHVLWKTKVTLDKMMSW